MNLETLTERSMELRKRFADVAQQRGQREWSREEVMQGFVGDVGDLMKLVMAKDGLRSADDVDKRIAHELADCLWSVLVLARLYDVDLQSEFLRMLGDVTKKLETSNAKSA